MSTQKVTLLTSDGVHVETTRRAAECSVLIRDLLEDLPSSQHEAIPIANVNEQVMRKVIEWCEHHEGDDSRDSPCPPWADRCMLVDDWDSKFIKVDQDLLFDIILAANYLDIEALLELGYWAVASEIPGRTVKEISTLFHLKYEPIPQPSAFCALKNLWTFARKSSGRKDDGDGIRSTRHLKSAAQDAIHLHQLLQLRLPPELVTPIVNRGRRQQLFAQSCELQMYSVACSEGEGELSVAGLYLSTPPIPNELSRFMASRIIFEITSDAQGPTILIKDGTFQNSFIWFEASILRPVQASRKPHDGSHVEALENDGSLPHGWRDVHLARQALNDRGWDFVQTKDGQMTWRVCHNFTTTMPLLEVDHEVKWERGVKTVVEDDRAKENGEGFLELLQTGDKVVLWARAGKQFRYIRVE
ncbi:hypothetical protein XA68_17146 [Ophiocordyceps unilateralis]|uniref:SKP1 component POZ domain-containing protein n=1 Tax=Ophiocordyceps unilateralis TaxID=268505 RepID=A0A2A9P4Y7_OPHUN|nr:hypothetical protein XA68_17146 [Ophiocordyceps unilateralis]